MMKRNPVTGDYEFWEPGEYRPTILWTPNEQEFKVPPHTGNEEQPFIPSQITVLPIPDKVGSDIESLPMPEEKDFRDYILILPIPNMPPVYVYLSKPRSGLPQDGHNYYPAQKQRKLLGFLGYGQLRKKLQNKMGVVNGIDG